MNEEITGVELAYLEALHSGQSINVDLDKLQEMGLIKITSNSIVLRKKGIDLLNEPRFVTSVTTVVERPEEWIEEFRKLFKGKKPGAMGDKKGCLMKMKRFLQENPEVTKDQIIAATKSYIQSCASDGYRFLQRSDYFIYKQDNHKGESSRLSAWIDELDGSEEIKDTSTNNFIREA
jgi:hypothetical protein